MGAHAIRLAGPWEWIVNGEEPRRIRLPYALPEGKRSASLRRKFHRPTGLTEDSLVTIVLTAAGRIPGVTINGEHVTASDMSDADRSIFDATTHLSAFNTLDVELNPATTELREAALEITG